MTEQSSVSKLVEENQTNNKIEDVPEALSEEILYESRFKRGGLHGDFRFYHAGNLQSAILKAKAYCEKCHVQHLSTSRHIITLDIPLEDIKYGV